MAAKKPATSAKYLPVYEKLRAQIDNGMLATGAILPTEDQLCEEFDVSRYALREALGLLERQGYIDRKRRAGTRVLARPAGTVFRHASGSQADLLDFVRGTTLELKETRIVQTDGNLARLLGCDELRQWFLMEGVRRDAATHRPIGVTQIYVDSTRAKIGPTTSFGGRAVYEWLEDNYGIRAKTLSQDINAVVLTPEDAKALNDQAGAPALRIIRRYFDDKQRIFEISVTTHRSEDFVYNIRIRLEE